MNIPKSNSLNRLEIFVLVFVFVLMAFGIIVSFINMKWFEEVYVVEDGFIEWLTVLPLLLTTGIAISYLIQLSKWRSKLFVLVVFVIALFCFFAAGEEISWGQRIFHIKTPEYFAEHNSQDELNIHNLVVDGEKVNKIVFSDMLIGAAVLYLLGLPILYSRNQKFKSFVDNAGVPVARLYQIIGCALALALPSISPSGKNSELLEFAGCFMFMLIVLYPRNREVFRKKS
jgi:hypothetical protein